MIDKTPDPEAYEEEETVTDKPPPIILQPGFIDSEERFNPSPPKNVKEVKIPEVSDFDVAFGTDAFYTPLRDLTNKFKNGGVWAEFLEGLITHSLDKRIQLFGRPGVRPEKAWRVLVATLNCRGKMAHDKLANGAAICHAYFHSIGYMRTDIEPRIFKKLVSTPTEDTLSG